MKYLFATLFSLCALLACQNNSANQQAGAEADESQLIKQGDVFLLCQEVKKADTEMDYPAFEVFLQLAESKVKVADVLSCQTITPDQYGRYQIPATAISAAGGWYAGAGDYLYVVEEEDNYVVMKGEMFEESEDGNYNYRVVAKYSKSGKEAL